MKYQFIVSAVNSGTPKNPNDASGAFIPSAQKHMKHLKELGHEVIYTPLDLKHGNISADSFKECDTLVYYGHGYKSGLQLGYSYVAGTKHLAAILTGRGVSELQLFACSYMAGTVLPVLLANWKTGLRVFGHTTAGHCAYNPRVAWQYRDEDGSEWSKDYDIDNQTPAFWRKLRKITPTMYYNLPNMNSAQVISLVDGVE